MTEPPPPSYADAISDTTASLSPLSPVGNLRNLSSPTMYRDHIHRPSPSRSSSGDSGYFSAGDPSSPVASLAGASESITFRPLSGSPEPMESGYHETISGRDMSHVAETEDDAHIRAAGTHARLDTLLDVYRRTRVDAKDKHTDVEVHIAEIWLIANATRPKEDRNVTWPGNIVETRASKAWSLLVGDYGFLGDKRYSTKKWGDLQEMLMHLKLEVPYIHSVKDWMKRLLASNKNTPDSDHLVFLPGYRSKHPASVAWKKWENMAHKRGRLVERVATWQFMREYFAFYQRTCVEREQFGVLRSAMQRMLKAKGMADFVDLRSEAALSYEA